VGRKVENHYLKYGKKYYESHKEREKERNKEYYELNKDKVLKRTSERSLRYRYGLTPEDLMHMHEQQGGVCLICKGPPKEGRNLDVDHCHTTGKIRGLLCNNCNRGLGHFQDNPSFLLTAAEYLKGT
jgi:hypothetical protein